MSYSDGYSEFFSLTISLVTVKVENFSKKVLLVTKKVVLLHPLSEGEGTEKGRPEGGKFIESLRPAQEERSPRGRREAAFAGREKEHIDKHQCGNPVIRINKLVQHNYNEEFDPGSG